jgi:uncharacterized glyoxalase superfamily protein PhnB
MIQPELCIDRASQAVAFYAEAFGACTAIASPSALNVDVFSRIA